MSHTEITEQTLSVIHANDLPLNPNSVVLQVHKLDSTVKEDDVLMYMHSQYGWRDDFYIYYGMDMDTTRVWS